MRTQVRSRSIRCSIFAIHVLAFLGSALAIVPAFGGEDDADGAIRLSEVGKLCIDCHRSVTPRIVADWELSRHSRQGVDCATCHGDGHKGADDAANVATITAETCATCHETQYQQFTRGKHSMAWRSMKAMPTIHWRPIEMTVGMEGCGGCHKIGLKTESEIAEMREAGISYGLASCDSCHTRHTFAKIEAQQPEACATCHIGYDQAQWEMYSTSKHGIRYRLVREGILPETASAPSCRDCHMQEGSHEVRTAWGYLGLRTNATMALPDESKDWWADRAVIMRALGLLDAKGEPTDRWNLVESTDLLRTSTEDFQRERGKMIAACAKCHSEKYARTEMGRGDHMVQHADRLMAEAIRIVGALYEDGILRKPADYKEAYPDLLSLLDAPTQIETRLFRMFLKHRMSAFKGAFHSNPDFAQGQGWGEMEEDLTAISAMAEALRERAEDR